MTSRPSRTQRVLPKLKRRILWVEDDPDNAKLLAPATECSRFEIVLVEDWREALSLLMNERFDLCLIHKWQGDNGAFDLCRRIRSNDPLTPILIYASVVYKADTDNAWAAGAQAYWQTPTSPALLEMAIDLMLTKTAAQATGTDPL